MKLVKKNQKLHNPDSPLLIGDVNDSDVVMEVNEPIYIEMEYMDENIKKSSIVLNKYESGDFFRLTHS